MKHSVVGTARLAMEERDIFTHINSKYIWHRRGKQGIRLSSQHRMCSPALPNLVHRS